IIEYVNYCIDEILNYYVVIDKCDKEKKEKSKEIMIRNIEQMEKPKDHEEIFTDFIKLSSGREEKVERILTGILYEINIFMSRLHLMKRIEENRFIQEKTSLKHTIAMGLIVKQMASDLLPYANTYVNNSRSVRETFTDKKIYKTLISTHIENKNINIDGDFPSDIETMAERLFRDLHRG
ncbi:hypothetical protein, partial [Salinivibrio sp. IB643]|uniref:hypothetical protein n=1 Tax=Salinivibrio sp. IB643 TaxID=1909445 RepID=UPI0009CA5EA5